MPTVKQAAHACWPHMAETVCSMLIHVCVLLLKKQDTGAIHMHVLHGVAPACMCWLGLSTCWQWIMGVLLTLPDPMSHG